MSGNPSNRVLTVKQPWADLIMSGVKDVENWSWPVSSTLPKWWACTNCRHRWLPNHKPTWCPSCQWGLGNVMPDGPFPFTLGIHAAAKVEWPDLDKPEWAAWDALNLWDNDQPGFGVLLGTVTVSGCHHADECFDPVYEGDDVLAHTGEGCSRWAEPDVSHWTLTDPQPLDVPVPMKGKQGLWTADLAAR